MIKINLLAEGKRPAAVRKAKPSRALLEGQNVALWLTLLGLLVPLLVVGGWYLVVNHQLEQRRQEVAAAQKEVDELQAVLREVADFKAKKAELEHKISVINELKANQRGPVQVMDSISRALPDLLWLDHMTVGATSISLSGRAFNMNAVANFMENLDRVPEFQEPVLRDSAKQNQIYTFTLDFNYSYTQPDTKGGAAEGGKAAAAAVPGA